MIKSWLASLFGCTTEVEKRELRVPATRKKRRHRKRLTHNEVMSISRDIHLNKTRKSIMQVYSISAYTYHKIKHGEHHHQRG